MYDYPGNDLGDAEGPLSVSGKANGRQPVKFLLICKGWRNEQSEECKEELFGQTHAKLPIGDWG